MTGYDFHPEAALDLDEIGNLLPRLISMPLTE